ncbi:hypothetical protein GTA08_BOTSDO02017 [Neofusicoccum parvum]|nr:hypothetical protein GTA08_BOTSDO02017 [Neofusicoccum parvum]
MPPEAYFLFHRLAIFADETASLRNASQNWRSRERLGEVVLHSETRSKQLRADVDATHHTLITDPAQADTSSSAIAQVTDALIHARHVSVVGICLFYAVMSTNISVPPAPTASTTHTPPLSFDAANLTPSSAGQISTHIATSLHSHSASDPSRPLIRTFLETFGRDRMDTLETQLTAFISLCDDARLHGVPFAPPLRRTAAGMLSSCKDVVENNAARMKGWGGAHGRIGVQIVLLGEVARRLEGMDGVMAGGEPEGEGEGVGMGMGRAAARLVRGLQRILKAWERREREKERGIGHADGEEVTAESNTAGPTERSGTGLEAAQLGDDSRCLGDLFVDWDSWPQIDGYDWSELFLEGAGI